MDKIQACRFFIDDSNLWIEAKKFAAKGKNNRHLKGTARWRNQDPRVRIDLGALMTEIAGSRPVWENASYLYGSKPPPNDSVWKSAKRKGYEVEIFDREGGQVDGKEKEVDNAMAATLADKAAELAVQAQFIQAKAQELSQTVFVVVTGDRDMRPAIKLVLKRYIHVELWGWDEGISQVYRDMDQNEPLFKLCFLDSIFERVSFTQYRSTRPFHLVDRKVAVVLCDFVNQDQYTEEELESAICQKIDSLNHLFFIAWSTTRKELVVEFPDAETKVLDALIEGLRRLFKQSLTVLAWMEYNTRNTRQKTTEWKSTGHEYGSFGALVNQDLDDEPAQQAQAARTVWPARPEAATPQKEPVPARPEIPDPPGQRSRHHASTLAPLGAYVKEEVNESNVGGEWKQYGRDQNKAHKRAMKKAQSCSFGVHCGRRGQCGYKHTDEQLRLFDKFPNRNFTKWKSVKCENTRPHAAKDCSFAHAGESWCPGCLTEGHFHGDPSCSRFQRRP